MEVELTASEMVVRIRSEKTGKPTKIPQALAFEKRQSPSGDCLTCGMVSCFRHPAATAAHAPAMGHSAFLLDARMPEFDAWCRGHSRDGDRWFLPLDGRRWKKPNYQWSPPAEASVEYATLVTLWRAFRQRRIPAQGATRQRVLLDGEAALARQYAKMLDPTCRHVVVSQNLLPHLWRTGALGGRSFDVLIERWPMDELQRRLDQAKTAHPESTTLADFRADPELLMAEREALAAAARLITPHRAIAKHFGERAWLIDWIMPEPLKRKPSAQACVFFPASRLGRKGAFELAEAMRDGLDVELLYLGRATEGVADPFGGLACRRSGADGLASAHALVLPAWIEHQPRLALLALASGIPVIATAACGLPEHPMLHVLDAPDAKALRDVILKVLQPSESQQLAGAV
jgi:hypothetical protein